MKPFFIGSFIVCLAAATVSGINQHLVCKQIEDVFNPEDGAAESGRSRRLQGPPGKTGSKGERGIPGLIGSTGPKGTSAVVDYEKINATVEDKVHMEMMGVKEEMERRFNALTADVLAIGNRLNSSAQLGLTKLGWFRGLNNDWYKIYTTHATYEDAVRECNSLGAQLVASGMRDPATRSAIISKLIEHSDISVIWIGLDDLVQESHHVWVDGVTATDDNTDWNEGEPNNYGGSENCVEIREFYGWKFNDEGCSEQLAYVCELILQ